MFLRGLEQGLIMAINLSSRMLKRWFEERRKPYADSDFVSFSKACTNTN